jgi:hypothetical protein
MKRTLSWTLIFLLLANYTFAQQGKLPFENNDITVAKLMAGFLMIFVYFIPTLIARDKVNFKLIFVFNILTAWTMFGWFACFLWALKAKSKMSDTLTSAQDIEDESC